MLLPVLYMENLDEIDSKNLSRGEIQVRQIAKNFSLIPAFFVYAIFLPLLMILYYCSETAKEAFEGFIFTFILKPTRWFCYKIVYIICNFVRKFNT